MRQPVKYLHVGYPKSASTALQAHFFSKHPELHHLGARSGGTEARYVSEDVAIAIEMGLRLEKDAAFDLELTRQVFDKQVEIARQHNKKAVGLSSECLCFTMTYEPDPSQKARRMQRVFSSDVRVIILIREQWSFIKSIYREYIKGGLHLTFKAFTEAIYYNQAKGFLHDLNYQYIYELYKGLFGEENILMLPYEALKAAPEQALMKIQRHLGVTPLIGALPNANHTPDGHHSEAVRRLNAAFRPNHARSVVEPHGAYRCPPYFKKKLGVSVPETALQDQQFIRDMANRNNTNRLPYEVPALVYEVTPLIKEKLDGLFRAWNQELNNAGYPDLGTHSYLM